MPREFALGDIYVPTLLLIFLLTVVLNWSLNWVLAKLELTRYVWHPALFHIAVFICLFAAIALTIYR